MTSELWKSYRELESSVSRLRKELSQIWSTQEQVIKFDAEATKRAINEALSWTCSLLKSIEDADSNLLLCETSSELEKSTEEGKEATLVILEKFKTSWGESCRSADLALMHAMDLSVDLSNFYGSRVISLEREISQTAHEIQESIQKVEEDLENIRTSQIETERKLISERKDRDAAEEEAASKRSVRTGSTAVAATSAAVGVLSWTAAIIFPLLIPVTLVASVTIVTGAVGGTVGAVVSSVDVAAIESRIESSQKRSRELDKKLDASSKRSTELRTDQKFFNNVQYHLGFLQRDTKTMRNRAEFIQKGLSATKNQTRETLLRTGHVQNQVECMAYIDTREELAKLLETLVLAIEEKKEDFGFGTVGGDEMMEWLKKGVEEVYERTQEVLMIKDTVKANEPQMIEVEE